MKELTAKQMEEVSGGNPAVVILVVLAGRAAVRYAAPRIGKAITAIGGTIAAAIGAIHGNDAAK